MCDSADNVDEVSLQGLRDENQDCSSIKLNFGKKNTLAPIDCLIICDGHGGAAVSKRITPLLELALTEKSNKYPISREKLEQIFNNIQKIIVRENIAQECGSTVLVLLRFMHNDTEYMQLINLGDSRAVISNNGMAHTLTLDHKPNWINERLRINKINENSKDAS